MTLDQPIQIKANLYITLYLIIFANEKLLNYFIPQMFNSNFYYH